MEPYRGDRGALLSGKQLDPLAQVADVAAFEGAVQVREEARLGGDLAIHLQEGESVSEAVVGARFVGVAHADSPGVIAERKRIDHVADFGGETVEW